MGVEAGTNGCQELTDARLPTLAALPIAI